MAIDEAGYLSDNPIQIEKCALCEKESPLTFHHIQENSAVGVS